MTASRNRLAVLAAILLAGTAAAQDGSGIPRDPSQPAAPDRRAPTREPSVAVPLPPSGTIGSPSGPSSADDFLPSAEPSTSQPGDFAEPSDGSTYPSQPRVLSTSKEDQPNELPVGELPSTPSRQQVLIESHDMKPGSVEVTPLGHVDASGQGTLEQGDGGLGLELWAGSDYATIAELLGEIPVGTASPVLNDLARRVLLTGARLDRADMSGPTLFELRTQRLLDAGLVRDLRALLDKVGATTAGPARRQALLLNGDTDAACADLEDSTDGPALQLKAACQVLAGDTAAAALSADLARVKGVDDPTFFALMSHLADGAPLDAADIKSLTPLTLALAQKAEIGLTPAALKAASLSVVAALALDKKTPASVRAAAAERAGAAGAIPAEAALDILRSGGKTNETGAEVQAVFAAADLGPKAKALAKALSVGDRAGRTAFFSRLLARPAWDTPPAPQTTAYAEPITRILLLSGRGDRVADWLNVATATPATLSAAGASPVSLTDELLVRVAMNAPTNARVAAASEALARMAESGDQTQTLRALIYAGTLQAIGFDIPPAASALLASSSLMAAAPVGQVEIAELQAAARDKHIGETILRTLIALGQGGPAEAHPAVVIEAAAALYKVGLKAEASATALEAALARPTGRGG